MAAVKRQPPSAVRRVARPPQTALPPAPAFTIGISRDQVEGLARRFNLPAGLVSAVLCLVMSGTPRRTGAELLRAAADLLERTDRR